MTTTVENFQAGQTAAPLIPAPRNMNSRRQARALSDLTLAATSTAVNVANLFVDYTLREWDCLQLAAAGRGVASELVEDAVKQTGIPEPGPRWTDLQDLAVLRLRLVLLDGSVICEVADRHDQPPAPSGEFQSLCKQWNSYRTSVGRVVWAELEIPAYELTEHGLPKRVRPKTAETTRRPATPGDVELLRRVAEGLEKL